MRRAAAVAAALALLALAPPAAADPPADFTIVRTPASARNYARANRPARAIRLVVIHVVEGSYWGAISWFRNPLARVSSHYVVSRDGRVAQSVGDRHVAWHAGNGWVNRHSIGIEHEGYTWTPWTFTDLQYRASARLTARVLRRSLRPIDRRHVIGHNEVPDPYRRGRVGGFGHHTDPGPSWDWARYLSYVRAYARGGVPPPRPFDVTISRLALNQTVTGAVRVEGVAAGKPAERVEFRVDGVLRDTQRTPPYLFGGGAWDTTLERNGRHVLSARAVAADGRKVDASVVVNVSNPPIRVTAVNVTEGQSVSGVTRVEATVKGPVKRVEFVVDDVVRATATVAPYAWDWDTAIDVPGPHRLVVRAVGGRSTASRAVTVFVTP